MTLVTAKFKRLAPRYHQKAWLVRLVAERLLERLDYIKLKPQRILDLGSGAGFATHLLHQRYPKAQIFACDLVHRMLTKQQPRWPWQRRQAWPLQTDMHHLPFANNSVDLIVMNLVVLTSSDRSCLFAELARVLRPGGLLFFSSMGPDTLRELAQAWRQVDDYVHVTPGEDMHQLGDELAQAQFIDPVMDMEYLRVEYKTLQRLLTEVREQGAYLTNPQRCRTLLTPRRLAAVESAYRALTGNSERLPATVEIIYGHAAAPALRQVQATGSGEVRIALTDLKAQLRN